MATGLHVAGHLTPAEVYGRLKRAGCHWRRQKWLVVYTAVADPRPLDAIARQLGVSPSFVYRALAAYNPRGPAAFETPGKGGRRRCHLSLADERAFLEPFIARPSRPDRDRPADRAGAGGAARPPGPRDDRLPAARPARLAQAGPRPAHPAADPAAREALKTAAPSG